MSHGPSRASEPRALGLAPYRGGTLWFGCLLLGWQNRRAGTEGQLWEQGSLPLSCLRDRQSSLPRAVALWQGARAILESWNLERLGQDGGSR